jgi:predicted RNA-binding protein YlqC (UPF0109 family)
MRDESKNPITRAVSQLVSGICNYPNSLKIVDVETDDALVLTIYPHTADTRLLVGKRGQTIKALEWLGSRAGRMVGKRCFIGLENSFDGENGDEAKFVPNDQFDVDGLKRLMSAWLALVFPKSVGMDFRNSVDGELRIYLKPEDYTSDDAVVIRALTEVFYPYGMNNGCVVKVRPAEDLKSD